MKYIIAALCMIPHLLSAQLKGKWIYVGVAAHAGFSKGSTYVSDNSDLVLVPAHSQASTVLSFSAAYHNQGLWTAGISLHAGNCRLMFEDKDIQLQSKGLEQVHILENMKYRALSIDYKKYFTRDENLKYYISGSFWYQYKLSPDSSYQNSLSIGTHNIELAPQYKTTGIYLVPEIGVSYHMENYGIAELGLTYRIGFQTLTQGTYSYLEAGTNRVLNTNHYKASGNYPALQIRYMLPIYEIKKKKDKNKPKIVKKNNVVFNDDNVPVDVEGRSVKKQGDIRVKTKTITFHIWDGGFEDGDSVSLNINGEWVLTNYLLTKDKKAITVTIEPETNNYLVLYAVNLGKEPPNTIALSYFDGKQEVRLNIKSNMKECGAINFQLDEDE